MPLRHGRQINLITPTNYTFNIYIKFTEEVIEYIKRTVEEERERNAESRAMLENELMEARRTSEQITQLTALRMQIENAASGERPVYIFMLFVIAF